MKKLILFILFTPLSSFATLGQDRGSVQVDMNALHGEVLLGALAVSAHPEIHVDALRIGGHTVKQFSLSDGKIFAISWRGANHPSLKQLLNAYYPEFQRLEDSTPKGRRWPLRPFVTSEVTVIRSGHLGDIRGAAYLNGKMPKGLRTEDLL